MVKLWLHATDMKILAATSKMLLRASLLAKTRGIIGLLPPLVSAKQGMGQLSMPRISQRASRVGTLGRQLRWESVNQRLTNVLERSILELRVPAEAALLQGKVLFHALH
jgi:hypothetical protein